MIVDDRAARHAQGQLSCVQDDLTRERGEAARREAEADARHVQLKAQNDALSAKVENLAAAEREMREKLDPILKMAKERNPSANENDAIEMLPREMNAIMHPKLEFLSDRTKQAEITDKGQYKTDYYFRSKYPVFIRDAMVVLRFDTELLDAKGGVSNMLPFTNNAQLYYLDKDRRAVAMSVNQLGEAGLIEISVFTKAPPKLLLYSLSP